MVKIRLKRMGKKRAATYRLVAANDKFPRDGRFIEELGFYNPHSKELKLQKELILKWLKIGAKPTDIARKLIKSEKIMEEFAKTKIKKIAPKKKKLKIKKS